MRISATDVLLSSGPTPSPTPEAGLRTLLSAASLVLWDFDGPVCGLFAGLRAPRIAAELRSMAAAVLPRWRELDGLDDPLAVLRRSYDAFPSDPDGLVSAMRKRLEELETHAAATAEPTPGAFELMEGLLAADKRLVIATNNSEAAARAYLELHGIVTYFGAVVGRHDDPRLMKPHPYCLERLLAETGTGAADGLMIGDSPADAVAARAAGVAFVGYHPAPAKLRRLREAGAEHLVADLAAMRAAIDR
ncbi:HAD family hydrolase [Streptomyces sp. NBC_00344]|uniref:HAD family hydrolase n=1 Tax=Streptomyces sp. NBC_00344 TaxID=2975720 RepID=UPI002E21F8A7